MISSPLNGFLRSLPVKTWLSHDLTLAVHRFGQRNERREIAHGEGLILAAGLQNSQSLSLRISPDNITSIPSMLYGVVAVYNPSFQDLIIHTATIVDLEPKPRVAFGIMTTPGIHIVDIQKHLLEEAARGFSTYLFSPETIEQLLLV